MITVKRCDNCGRFNPPLYAGNPRLCGACVRPDGFYKLAGQELGANGKIGRWKLRFPIRIEWRGWWTLA